jgi:hypothetical protein
MYPLCWTGIVMYSCCTVELARLFIAVFHTKEVLLAAIFSKSGPTSDTEVIIYLLELIFGPVGFNVVSLRLLLVDFEVCAL